MGTAFQSFVRNLWALSLVPKHQIIDCWENYLLAIIPYKDDEDEDDENSNYNKSLKRFVSYFEKTYLGEVNPRRNVRKSPRFKFETWNKVETIMNEKDLTTNFSEGYNHQLKTSMPR